MLAVDFDITFRALTGNEPFPWQRKLYDNWFAQGKFPDSCTLPTGLGKTSVVAVWLIALVNCKTVPRRLVYVVNRRTVVDQTTDEVEKYRRNLTAAGITEALALSTLRGQFADNREWSADPSRPAVICGTVDMIGSRLLFSGYGVGFKLKPLHAGFLGQDALLVHDEAHLETAFQKLIESIRDEQLREPAPFGEQYRLRVMALTATSRGGGEVFELTKEEKSGEVPVVRDRLFAKKGVKPVACDRAKVAAQIGRLALRHKDSGRAVMIFVRTIDDVTAVRKVLTEKSSGVKAEQVQTLTGTLRGLERDQLATADPVFARFMPEPKVEPATGTVYLICTSAGEVGVDISADHLVSDLTPLDSMAQRFGRVNRRGGGAAEIDVVYESDPDLKEKDDPLEKARWATLARLGELPACEWIAERREASPREIGRLIRGLTAEQRIAAFTPEPVVFPVSDILFDVWALTTIRNKLPGRPIVEPYLHGLAGWEPPETHVAWREDVARITNDLLKEHKPEDLLDDFPLKPHELLRDNSSRVYDRLKKRNAAPDSPVWVVANDNSVTTMTLGEMIDRGKKAIEHATILLPPSVGGLSDGFLNSGSDIASDVADKWFDELGQQRRARLWDNDPVPGGMRLIRAIDTKPDADEAGQDEAPAKRFWHWYELQTEGGTDGSKSNRKPVEWKVHVGDVERNATDILSRLPLPDAVKEAVIIAARFHDHGKKRKQFQTVLGNVDYPKVVLAKSGKKSGRVTELYRHEFGSLVDLERQQEFRDLTDEDQKDLMRHLIAAHHGRGRPHFPADEAFDPDHGGTDEIAAAVPRRFARLQRRYGRWGLAYLESLLRAADYAASAKPSAYVEDEK